MDIKTILAALYAQRDHINQAIEALKSLNDTSSAPTKPGRKPAIATVPTAPKKRVVSAKARRKMAAAARKRWAVRKAAKAPATKKSAPVASPAVKGARKPMSAATKKKLAVAAKARWAEKKKAAVKA